MCNVLQHTQRAEEKGGSHLPHTGCAVGGGGLGRAATGVRDMQSTARADLFYVHPTTPVSDPEGFYGD